MDKLFLIRVDMERFLGPYTLRQVKEAYQRMEFGLQDEVAGNLRQWVSFDDFESIRRHYPELVQLVQREMLSGWGMSSQSALGQADLPIKAKPRPVARGSWVMRLILLIIVGSSLALGTLLYRDGQFENLLLMLKDRQLYTARSLYGDRYNVRFESFMDRNHDAVNQAIKRKKTMNAWLPYVRAIAFERDGRWEGLSAKKMRGNAEKFLPMDCSMSSWEQRWTQSRELWRKFLDGREFPQQEWAMMLAMDPHWIRNRSPLAGWLSPGHYAEACLRMGLKSLQRQPAGSNLGWEIKVFNSRLRWQLGVINSKIPDEDFEMSGSLWALSCIEEAEDEAAMHNCMNSVSAKQGWRDVFDISILRRRLENSVSDRITMDLSAREAFQKNVDEFSARIANFYIPYDLEIKFFQEILQ
ncbi:MAG: hypothetical protein NTX25_01760, partial [Proteobacteria bacterium]|nr:hypothetical protein [Pseudomonadota bacterium]